MISPTFLRFSYAAMTAFEDLIESQLDLIMSYVSSVHAQFSDSTQPSDADYEDSLSDRDLDI